VGFDVEFLSAPQIVGRFGFSRPAAILSQKAAQIDPFQLNQRLLARAIRGGLRLFTRTELAGYEVAGDGIIARTTSGPRIRARHLVYATGYEAAGMIDPKLAHAQISYAIVSQPQMKRNDPYERPLIWEAADTYLYLRTTSDQRDMIGGEDDHDLTHLGNVDRVDQKRRMLEARFHEFYPDRDFNTAAAWAGVFETTPNGLPYIGPHRRFPHALFSLGYGGNGITFSVIAADLLRDQILGKPNPDATIFRFDRR
jgi:glycine/D-amino acid oxidase-like deaminating enzyme